MGTIVWGRVGKHVGEGAMAAALGIVGPMLTSPPQAAPVEAAGLTPFASCDALRQWYVDQTIGQVGAYGWNGSIIYAMRTPAAISAAGVEDSATGTNTQEAGIDEPDVAKTDGRIVVRLRGQQVVVTDVTGTAPRELSTWTLPSELRADGLLLVDGHVLVTGQHGRQYVVDSVAGEHGAGDSTDLYDLDLSSPTAPRLVAHTTWSGATLSLRQYGDTVRLVTSTGLPDLDFVKPRKGLDESEATARNREIVASSTIQQWLPHFSLDGATSSRAVDCDRIYHRDRLTGSARSTATIGVFTLHPGATTPVSAAAVTGRGSQVYSSSDRLYVWDTSFTEPRFTTSRSTPIRPLVQPFTDVHAFALDGDETTYVGSGRINGQVRDRWSLDEHDGHLRVAVTWPRRLPGPLPGDPVTPDTPGTSVTSSGDNGVVVLDEQGDRLVQVGQLRGLGVDEQIQSVRWFDDLAVLVTFRQTDPLYTVDLSDPEHPHALGELHLPGFSSYLHPIGGDRLLGLGSAAPGQADGGGGAKVTVFDLAHPTRTRQLDEVGFGSGSWLAAAADPHAFTFVPSEDGGTAVTTIFGPDAASGIPVAIRVTDGRLMIWYLPSPGGENQRALPLPDGRVALTGAHLVLTSLEPTVE